MTEHETHDAILDAHHREWAERGARIADVLASLDAGKLYDVHSVTRSLHAAGWYGVVTHYRIHLVSGLGTSRTIATILRVNRFGDSIAYPDAAHRAYIRDIRAYYDNLGKRSTDHEAHE